MANGFQALVSNTTGMGNVAIGSGALSNNVSGVFNVAIGSDAGTSVTTGDRNIYVNHPGVVTESMTTRIGLAQTRAFIAGVAGAPVTGSGVVVNAFGQLGVAASSERFRMRSNQ